MKKVRAFDSGGFVPPEQPMGGQPNIDPTTPAALGAKSDADIAFEGSNQYPNSMMTDTSLNDAAMVLPIAKTVPKAAEGLSDLIGYAPGKLADEAGAIFPKLYRGVNPKGAIDAGDWGVGEYHTGDPDIARAYARGPIDLPDAGGKVIEASLDIKNPLEFGTVEDANAFRKKMLGPSYSNPKSVENSKKMQDYLESNGYDGVVTHDANGTYTTKPGMIYEAVKLGKRLSEGGKVMSLKSLFEKAKNGPVVEDSNLAGLAKLFQSDKSSAAAANDVDASTDTAKGMAGGGWVDKIEQLGGSLAGRFAGAATDPIGAMADAAQSAPVQSAIKAELPVAQNIASDVSGGVIPAAQPSPALPPQQPEQPSPDQNDLNQVMGGSGGSPVPQSAPKSSKPDPVQLMQSMTGNDPNQYQQLISSLQDGDKRASFAKALAVIGDTLGNMGQAKAGQTPSGFTSLQAVSGITDATRQRLIDQLSMKVAADPNSQSSKLAQQSLMQAMNIQPNDPRAKAIMSMPAAAIQSQFPQMKDAIDLNIKKEGNQLGYAQLAAQEKERQTTANIASAQQQTAGKAQQASNAKDILTNTSSFNPLNWGIQGQAKQTLAGGQGAQQSQSGTSQDAAAVNWAHLHPTDPRSRAILQANGL